MAWAVGGVAGRRVDVLDGERVEAEAFAAYLGDGAVNGLEELVDEPEPVEGGALDGRRVQQSGTSSGDDAGVSTAGVDGDDGWEGHEAAAFRVSASRARRTRSGSTWSGGGWSSTSGR